MTTRKLLHHLPVCSAPSLFRKGDVNRRVGCTVETSCLLGGEVRQEDRGRDKGRSLPPSLFSRCHPDRCSGLNVSGEVESVALEFGEGDGRMLQVVEQNLDLEERGNLLSPYQ